MSNKNDSETAVHHTALIHAAYQVAVDPNSYDELVDRWSNYLIEVLGEDVELTETKPKIAVEIDNHLQRSFEILDRLGRANQPDNTRGRTKIIFDKHGMITSCNKMASTMLGARIGDPIADLEMSTEARSKLSNMTKSRRKELLLFFDVKKGLPYPMLLTSAVDDAQSFQLVSLTHNWTDAHEVTLKTLFGLTDTETRVARALMGGASLSELAASTGRSVHTLRTQLRDIRRKTYTSNQQQLMQVMAGLENLTHIDSINSTQTGVLEQLHILPDGRKLMFKIFGPSTGTPCLFIHNMLCDPTFTPEAISAIHKHRLRLICPTRPSFGDSDPDPITLKDPAKAPDRFAEDIQHLLAALNITRFVAVGHMSGSIYAFRLAKLYPQLVAGVYNIAGGVPIVELAQFTAMNARQKAVALTARFVPRLLPAILRSGIAQLDSNGAQAFLNALYPTGTADRATADRNHIRTLLYDGFQRSVKQGHLGFATDAWHVVRNWSHLCEGIDQPVFLLHGEEDLVVSAQSVETFSKRMGYDCEVIKSYGQLILYAAPAELFSKLSQAAKQVIEK